MSVLKKIGVEVSEKTEKILRMIAAQNGASKRKFCSKILNDYAETYEPNLIPEKKGSKK